MSNFMQRELARAVEITRTAALGDFAERSESSAVDPLSYCSGEHTYTPLLLRASDENGQYVVGVAMLRAASAPLRASGQRFVPNLSKALLATGDVDCLRLG